MRVLHTMLRVGDLERSLAFYTDVLGLAPERVDQWRRKEIGFPSVRINESTLIDLMQGEVDRDARPNLNHFCLVTDSPTLDAAIQTLGNHGVAIETGPVQRWGARGNARSVYFRDPDNNQIELRTYA